MNDMDNMVSALKGGIDANSTDAPQMSIDPKSNAVSVVGDPNKIDNNPRPYKLVFAYPENELSEDDKLKMKKSDDAEDEYTVEISYEGKRVRPLHRTKIAMWAGAIFNEIGLFSEDGSYDSSTLNTKSAEIFLGHIEEIAEMAELILGLPEGQKQFIRADSLVDFFIDMLYNEPNVIKEAANFLDAQSKQRLAKVVAETMEQSKTQNTQQS